MNAQTLQVVEAFPAAFEVAILHLPAGSMARVHHPSGMREYRPLLVQEDVYAVVPGFAQVIDWGAVPCWHYTLKGIRNGRHRLDRAAWHDAAALLALAPVVYISYERRDHFGKPRWTAVDAGVEPLGASRRAEKAQVGS